MSNNSTVRFYVGFLFYLMGAGALGESGVRNDRPLLLVVSGLLAVTAFGMAYVLRADAMSWGKHPMTTTRPPTTAGHPRT